MLQEFSARNEEVILKICEERKLQSFCMPKLDLLGPISEYASHSSADCSLKCVGWCNFYSIIDVVKRFDPREPCRSLQHFVLKEMICGNET